MSELPALLRRVLPLWRCLFIPIFFGVGCCLNVLWGYRLFDGALKMLRSDGQSKVESKATGSKAT